MSYATHIDLYQLTSLVPHWDAGRAQKKVWMSFFSRRLPKGHDGQTAREFIVACGIQRCLNLLTELHFDEARIETLCRHPLLGPALQQRPELIEALRQWRFQGEVWGVNEGEILWANPALDQNKKLLNFNGVRPSAMPPYLQVHTDLLTAKLIETPILSIINHMSMVATKAAHICRTAHGRPVLELGSRRTHIEAAVDAAVAAYIGGVTGTSNVEAHHRFGVPVLGTMDHFAVQSWESSDLSIAESERAFFKAFASTYPNSASLLVDTYDMFGQETGIRNAVRAAQEAQVPLHGIRIDSQLSLSTINKARHLLDELGAQKAKIIVSGGVDEGLIKELDAAAIDAFGVGERLVTSADAPVGVGAVGKLAWIDGEISMKRAQGSGKATLPGPIQAFRGSQGDRLCLVPFNQSSQSFAWNTLQQADGERPLIRKHWDTTQSKDYAQDFNSLGRAREHCAQAIQEYTQNNRSQEVYLASSLEQAIQEKCSS